MDLTPRARSPLAEPRRQFASVMVVMVLVLAVVSVYVVCSVHLDEHAHGAAGAAEAVAHDAAAHDVAAAEPAGAGSHGCADHGMVTAQSDPVRPAPQGPAVVPVLAMQWLVSDLARHAPRISSTGTAPAPPSLHALGISRT